MKTDHLAWSKPLNTYHLPSTTYHLPSMDFSPLLHVCKLKHVWSEMITWSLRMKSLILANSGKAGWNHCSFLHKCLHHYMIITLSLGLPCVIWSLIFSLKILQSMDLRVAPLGLAGLLLCLMQTVSSYVHLQPHSQSSFQTACCVSFLVGLCPHTAQALGVFQIV